MPQHSLHHGSGFIEHYLKHKEIDELYISVFIKTLAQSLASIFIPVYLLNIGFQLFDVALYYIVMALALSACMWIFLPLNKLFGVKKMLAFGTLLHVAAYLLINNISSQPTYLLAACVYGFAAATYYAGFHVEFTRFSRSGGEGKDLSVISVVTLAAAATGPLLGAFLVGAYSFNVLFLTVAGILIISIIPLFASADYKVNVGPVNIKAIKKVDTPKKAITYQAYGFVEHAGVILWPTFIYLHLNNIVSTGAIISIVSLLMVISAYTIGRYVDKHQRTFFKIGAWSHASSWALRLLSVQPLFFLGANLYANFTNQLLDLAYHKHIIQGAKKTAQLGAYYMFRELNLNAGRIMVMAALAATGNFTLIFIIALLITPSYLLLLKK